MAINFDKALGIYQYSLGVRARRTEILASNISNADTPNYKAKDINFKDALNAAKSGTGISLSRTNSSHNAGFSSSMAQSGLLYRASNQPDTGDGNSVDLEVERNLFMKNSLEYQATLDFLNGSISGLRKAIKGQ
ncbi:flagellar basal body rod protein FlgB [Psychromonas arctica]|uniref:Flagellar basal body rod protein FlgB n=1 Tax=Psychromonas arctica TaxID=168275 RepID=A0ABU9HED6_9GAMM|nr:flagellar basal body rod protein FlgB [Psychromonas sp. L1A2]